MVTFLLFQVQCIITNKRNNTMIYDRFKFEQMIMDCWNITSDLNTIQTAIEQGATTNQEIGTMIAGIVQLNDLKFNKMFAMFEASLIHHKQTDTSNINIDLDTLINEVKSKTDGVVEEILSFTPADIESKLHTVINKLVSGLDSSNKSTK